MLEQLTESFNQQGASTIKNSVTSARYDPGLPSSDSTYSNVMPFPVPSFESATPFDELEMMLIYMSTRNLPYPNTYDGQ